MNFKLFLFCLLFLLQDLFCSNLFCQNLTFDKVGGQIGLSCSIGTHTQRLGLIGRFFYNWQFLQLNLQSSFIYNYKSLGSCKKGWEMSIQPGIAGIWGKKNLQIERNPFIHPISNQSSKPYSIGYTYILYFDKLGTGQNSGAFGFQIQNFSFYFENDFLAFQSKDRYRTGAMAFFYRWKDWQFGLKQLTYTGDPYSKFCPWIDDKIFPSVSGYIDMSSAPHGDKSLGILALQVERNLPLNDWLNLNRDYPFNQYIGAEIGIDAEQIRNLFQNKLIHDSKILPMNWGKVKNPHIPMICEDGCPFTFHDGQKIKPAKLYFQGWANNSILY
jgi:hypothetical protein